MFITPSFKKSLIVEQFQGNYLKTQASNDAIIGLSHSKVVSWKSRDQNNICNM